MYICMFMAYFFEEKLCKSSYSSMECFGACTSGKEGESTATGAVVRREQCSCGRKDSSSLSHRPSLGKMGPYIRTHSVSQKSWRPLLLFIPLRLGLSEINPAYYNALKVCFVLFYLETVLYVLSSATVDSH